MYNETLKLVLIAALAISTVASLPVCEFRTRFELSTRNMTKITVVYEHGQHVLEDPRLYRNIIYDTTKHFLEDQFGYTLAFTVYLQYNSIVNSLRALEVNGGHFDLQNLRSSTEVAYTLRDVRFVVATTNTTDIKEIRVEIMKSKPTRSNYRYVPNEAQKVSSVRYSIVSTQKYLKEDGIEVAKIHAIPSSEQVEPYNVRFDTNYWLVIKFQHYTANTRTQLALFDDTKCDPKINILSYKPNEGVEWTPYQISLDGLGPLYSIENSMDIKFVDSNARPTSNESQLEPPKEPVMPVTTLPIEGDDENTTVPLGMEPEESEMVSVPNKEKQFIYIIATPLLGLPALLVVILFLIRRSKACAKSLKKNRKSDRRGYVAINKPGCCSKRKHIKTSVVQDGVGIDFYHSVEESEYNIQDLTTGVVEKIWNLPSTIKQVVYSHLYGGAVELKEVSGEEESIIIEHVEIN